MARITTTTRVIFIKETIKEVFDKCSHQWIELTEISYDVKWSSETVRTYAIEGSVYINRDFIIEMQD